MRVHQLVVLFVVVLAGCTGFAGPPAPETETPTTSAVATGSGLPQFALSTSVSQTVHVVIKEVPSNETVLEQTYDLKSGEEVRFRDELAHEEFFITVRVEDGARATWRLEASEGMQVWIEPSGDLNVTSHTYG